MSALWFTAFGWTGIELDRVEPGIATAVQTNVATGIYAVLERLPLAGATSLLAAAIVAIFFVTSSDSGSFVVDMLTSGGHPDPPVWQRIFWAVSEGVIAAVLLLSGGLAALQSAAIQYGATLLHRTLARVRGTWAGAVERGAVQPLKTLTARDSSWPRDRTAVPLTAPPA